MKKYRKFLLYFLLSISFFLSGCNSNQYAQDFEQVDGRKLIIRFSHVVSEDTPKGQAALLFARLIEERSKGRIEVQVFPNGSLYRDGEEWEALINGDVQMIAPAMSKLTDKIPEVQVFDLPFYFSNLEQIHQLADGKIGKKIFTRAKEVGVIPLAIWDSGFKQFTNRDFPIDEPKDFQGLTFRIMPSPVLKTQFELLGAKVEVKKFNDVYQALLNKEIDGQENTISNIYSNNFYQAQHYLTISNHGYLGYLVLFNNEFWKLLSADEQRLIINTMHDVTKWEREKAKLIEQEQLKSLLSCNCIKIKFLTTEQYQKFQEYFLPLHEKIIKQFDFSLTTK